ncbi:MAG: lysophospholipase [Clostridia bacterium]|nr:lysophospholipase [Clostridia bacterium]
MNVDDRGMKIREFWFPSATGVGEIFARAYLPAEAPQAVMAIHHGMAEHQERYLPFLQFLTKHGIAVYMHDMANHGKSNRKMEETGWFGEKDGWRGLVEDFRTVVQRAEKEYPGVPVIVMGHSMGSFICRAYCALYPKDGITGAIYMGTGGPNPAAGAGKTMASLIGKVKGKKHKSKTMDKMAFGTYNKRFENRTSFDWLTRDQKIVDRYIANPYCGFLFTVQGMHDLVSVNSWVNEEKWYQDVPKELPILIISGAEDPVGEYGAGVKKVAEGLKGSGHQKVTLKLYPDCRHEILNELNKEQVMQDLLSWVEQQL